MTIIGIRLGGFLMIVVACSGQISNMQYDQTGDETYNGPSSGPQTTTTNYGNNQPPAYQGYNQNQQSPDSGYNFPPIPPQSSPGGTYGQPQPSSRLDPGYNDPNSNPQVPPQGQYNQDTPSTTRFYSFDRSSNNDNMPSRYNKRDTEVKPFPVQVGGSGATTESLRFPIRAQPQPNVHPANTRVRREDVIPALIRTTTSTKSPSTFEARHQGVDGGQLPSSSEPKTVVFIRPIKVEQDNQSEAEVDKPIATPGHSLPQRQIRETSGGDASSTTTTRRSSGDVSEEVRGFHNGGQRHPVDSSNERKNTTHHLNVSNDNADTQDQHKDTKEVATTTTRHPLFNRHQRDTTTASTEKPILAARFNGRIRTTTTTSTTRPDLLQQPGSISSTHNKEDSEEEPEEGDSMGHSSTTTRRSPFRRQQRDMSTTKKTAHDSDRSTNEQSGKTTNTSQPEGSDKITTGQRDHNKDSGEEEIHKNSEKSIWIGSHQLVHRQQREAGLPMMAEVVGLGGNTMSEMRNRKGTLSKKKSHRRNNASGTGSPSGTRNRRALPPPPQSFTNSSTGTIFPDHSQVNLSPNATSDNKNNPKPLIGSGPGSIRRQSRQVIHPHPMPVNIPIQSSSSTSSPGSPGVPVSQQSEVIRRHQRQSGFGGDQGSSSRTTTTSTTSGRPGLVHEFRANQGDDDDKPQNFGSQHQSNVDEDHSDFVRTSTKASPTTTISERHFGSVHGQQSNPDPWQ